MDDKQYRSWRERIGRLSRLHWRRELRVRPGFQTHEHLLTIVTKLSSDCEPWGERVIGESLDCSMGCHWFHTLNGNLETDWGVCANARSPRVGLLTLEHMGCEEFEHDPRYDYLSTRAGTRALRRFQEAAIKIQSWRLDHRWVKIRGKAYMQIVFRRP